MTYRIAWLSPLTPASGVGTFSNAILRDFPATYKGERIDVTAFHVNHERLYRCRHRSVRIADSDDFHEILTLFDLIVYNIGNNREHHEPIFALLRLYPGIVICHDFVYQHYLADASLRHGKSFAPFAALMLKHGNGVAFDYLRRSRITSRTGQIRYSPWDTELSVAQPMSEAILALGSALVVHSTFARQHVEKAFHGPILTLGMPHDQKPSLPALDLTAWKRSISTKAVFRLVSFGHIQSTKCIGLALAALAASPILRRRIRYTIAGFVGHKGYYEHLKEVVASSQLDGIVSFETDVDERRLQDLLRDADIFLNLRRPNTEGASVSLIEQLDTGKPVVVLDSGCYAEVPTDAAVKAPADSTSDEIRTALEELIRQPGTMPAIGEAGRAFARTWSCASYGQELLRFAFEHRDLLERRAKAVAIGAAARKKGEPDEWMRELARARASFRYLDANMLATAPDTLAAKSADDLARYVATVVFGLFSNERLDRALSRFFARLDSRAAHWACVRFAIVAEATFGDDPAARERLMRLEPCYEPEFWAVIEAFPPRNHLMIAMLILARRCPTADELMVVGLDDDDGFPKRLRTRDLVRRIGTNKDVALERMARWLDESRAPSLDFALPAIDQTFECEVGDASFRLKADLSGFYAMEPDHAWTRGTDGFLGVRLGEEPVRIEVQVHHVNASSAQPATISIAHGDALSEIEVTDEGLHWLSLPVEAKGNVVWVRFATSVAARPGNGRDDRVLGICFKRLRVVLETAEASDPTATIRRFIDHGTGWAGRQTVPRAPGREERERVAGLVRPAG